MTTKLWVSEGGFCQFNGGLKSLPSQVYFAGIAAPSSKPLEMITNVASLVVDELAELPTEDSKELALELIFELLDKRSALLVTELVAKLELDRADVEAWLLAPVLSWLVPSWLVPSWLVPPPHALKQNNDR